MQRLQSLHLMDNTIIIFTSDNGGVSSKELGVKPTDNAPLREGKGFLYEGGIRVPLLMVWKTKIPTGNSIDAGIINTDFFPTLLDMINHPEKLTGTDGLSFNKIWDGEISRAQRNLYWHYPHFSNQGGRPAAAVQQGDFKLIEHYETRQTELYDLRRDPGEKNNIAAQYPSKASELANLLQQWRKEVNANMPAPNKHHAVKD
jgi:arylsulfatase A